VSALEDPSQWTRKAVAGERALRLRGVEVA
jgi:hypothetical protein